MKRFGKYWGDNFLKAVEGKELLATLFAAALIAITFIFHKKDLISIETQEQIILGIIILRFIAWIPFRRHAELEKEYKGKIGELTSQHAEKVAEIESRLTNSIQILEKEKAERLKVKITAEMRRDPGQYQQKTLRIKVLNGGSQIVRVEKVAILLVPRIVRIGTMEIEKFDKEMVCPQMEPTVSIDGHDAFKTWQILIDDTVTQIKSERRDNKNFGQAYLKYTNGKEETFEYETI